MDRIKYLQCSSVRIIKAEVGYWLTSSLIFENEESCKHELKQAVNLLYKGSHRFDFW